MDKNRLTQDISIKEVDIKYFKDIAIEDREIRDEFIRLLSHNKIMVYYHAFYIVDAASEERPDLFYAYWEAIKPLLRDANSYKRDIALTLLANMSLVDDQDNFDEVKDEYVTLICDPKFMTAQCCVTQLCKIVTAQEKYIPYVVDTLLEFKGLLPYKDKQKALLMRDIIKVLASCYHKGYRELEILEFIEGQLQSISPTTRKYAKELMKNMTK